MGMQPNVRRHQSDLGRVEQQRKIRASDSTELNDYNGNR